MPASISYKADCRFFRGDVPCAPHKARGVHCPDCPDYTSTDRNILIIKLGAIGDVIRTTPLLRRLRAAYPTARIWWITHTPDILPGEVDVKMRFDLVNVMAALAIKFDLLINLDKDREAAALADRIEASAKKGFILKNGIVAPIDGDAEHKFLTGIFDDLNKANTKHYVEEIFDICGYAWNGEEYLLEAPGDPPVPVECATPLVGLNTGCGGRWTSRLWPDEYWETLIRGLQAAGCTPLLLGGEQEHERNTMLATLTGAFYPGHFPLRQFMALMAACDVVVSAVTMAMHIAIGLRKPLVLFNNIFNRHEFELYGRGEIVEPSLPCTCFFRPTCVNPEYECMRHIEPDRVLEAVRRWLPARGA
jgi:ADP-heptose:LPS heptosyltransferase